VLYSILKLIIRTFLERYVRMYTFFGNNTFRVLTIALKSKMLVFTIIRLETRLSKLFNK